MIMQPSPTHKQAWKNVLTRNEMAMCLGQGIRLGEKT